VNYSEELELWAEFERKFANCDSDVKPGEVLHAEDNILASWPVWPRHVSEL